MPRTYTEEELIKLEKHGYLTFTEALAKIRSAGWTVFSVLTHRLQSRTFMSYPARTGTKLRVVQMDGKLSQRGRPQKCDLKMCISLTMFGRTYNLCPDRADMW